VSKKPDPASEAEEPALRHYSVLLRETVEALAIRPGGVYVDGTLGAGGHAAEMLKRSAPDGTVIGFDRDEDAIERSRERLAEFGSRAIIRQANFRDMPSTLTDLGYETIDGVLLDLGVSWFHLKTPDRGFSFGADGPLDMRMDRSTGPTAADLVNTLSREELVRVLRDGEEPRAQAIARKIEQARSRGAITRTLQLAEIVASVYPPYPRRINPATLTFQALRIAVNDELGALRDALEGMLTKLKPGGRIAVISFHSLEDRIVKRFFATQASPCICPPRLPICGCNRKPGLRILTNKPIMAAEQELAQNPASRSAKLRAAERL
jgi:16S rRNA (cytosine1402-N4)-methyltransferase